MTTKKTVALLVAIMAVVSVLAVQAADRQRVKEQRRTARFERIRLLGSPDIKYRQADSLSVYVVAPKSVARHVVTEVEGNCLVVRMKGNGNRLLKIGSVNGDGVTVYVTSPDLTAVELLGSGDFSGKGRLDTDRLSVSVKGSGSIKFDDIICDDIKTVLVGSGDADIKRLDALRSSVEVVGSGSVEMSQRKVRQTRVELKGSGDVTLKLQDCGELHTRLLGSGDVTLSGNVGSHKYYKRGTGDIDASKLQVKTKK
jgi:hypothetical protein